MSRVVAGYSRPAGAPLIDAADGVALAPIAVYAGAGLSSGAAVMGTTVGTAPVNSHPASGFVGNRAASAASTVNGARSAWAYVPAARDWSLVAAAARQLRRYRVEAYLMRESLGANVRTGFGISTGDTHVGLSTTYGVEVVSDPTGFGAELQLLSRLSSAGATTTTATGVDIAAGELVHIAFDLTEGTSPRLAVEVNGATVHTFTGLAEMPVQVLGLSTVLLPRFLQGQNPGSAAGATDWLFSTRYRVWAQ